MIRAVLFDLDGVIRHFEHDPGLEIRHGLEAGAIARIAFASPLIDRVTTGRMTRAEWIERIAEHVGAPAADEWARTPFTADHEALALVDELRAIGIRCAILTNGTDEIAEEMSSSGIGDRFDRVFNSAEIGHAKPDSRAFSPVLAALRMPATEVLFTDDSAAKLGGAIELGMPTHHFTSVAALRATLRAAGVPA